MAWTGDIILSVADYSIKDPFLFSDSGVDYLFYTYFSNAGGSNTADIGYAIKVDGSWVHQGIAISRTGSFGSGTAGIWAPFFIKVGELYHAFVCGLFGGTYTLARHTSSSPISGYTWQENLTFDHPNSGLIFDGAGEASNLSTGWTVGTAFTLIVEFMCTKDSPNYSYNMLIGSGDNSFAISLQDAGSTASSLEVFNSNLTPPNMYGRKPIPHNEIHRIALTYGGGNRTIYLNGDVDKITASTGTVPSMSRVYVGRRYDAVDKRYFNGSIFKIWFFNRELTAAEIKQQYIDDSITSGLTNHYDFTLGSADDLVGSVDLTVSGAVYGTVTGAKIKNIDADIITHNNKYYMVASGLCISLYESTDLVNWTFVKHLVNCALSGWDSTLIEAPDILFIDGIFYIFYGGGDSSTIQKIGIVTSNDITGPYVRVGSTGQLDLASPVAVNPGPISHPFVTYGDETELLVCVGTSVDGHSNQKLASYKSQLQPVQNQGPLRRDLVVTSGTEYPDLTVTAPLGPQFQAITEWTNNAAVDLSTFVATENTRLGSRGVAIWNPGLDAAGIVRADNVLKPPV